MRTRFVGTLVALSLVAVACGGSSNDEGGGSTDTSSAGSSGVAADPAAILTYGTMNANSLDPAVQKFSCEVPMLRTIYDTLVRVGADGELVPMLAQSWDFDSPTVLTMKLRPGVEFQDGTPLDAAAVKFNIDRALTDPASNIKSSLYMLDSVAVVDPATVRFTLKTPAGIPFLAQLTDRAGMMASPTAVKAAGTTEAFSANPVGAGAYEVDGAWRPQESLNVRAWDGYWDTEVPRLGGIDMTNVTQVGAVPNALKSGSLDLAVIDDAGDVPGLESDPNLVVVVNPSTLNRYWTLNPMVEPFDDVRVRQAVAYALDRDALAAALSSGTVDGIYQWYPEGTLPYDPELDELYPHDPDKARQLMAEAGYPDGFSFTGDTIGTLPFLVRWSELVQAQLAEVDIDMQINQVDAAQFSTRVIGGQDGAAQSAAAAWGGELTVDPDPYFRDRFLSTGNTNNGRDEDPRMRPLLDKAAAELDQEERADLYRQASRLAVEQVLEGVPILFPPAINAMADYVGGIDQAKGRCTMDFRGVYITQGKVPAGG